MGTSLPRAATTAHGIPGGIEVGRDALVTRPTPFSTDMKSCGHPILTGGYRGGERRLPNPRNLPAKQTVAKEACRGYPLEQPQRITVDRWADVARIPLASLRDRNVPTSTLIHADSWFSVASCGSTFPSRLEASFFSWAQPRPLLRRRRQGALPVSRSWHHDLLSRETP